MSIPWPARPAVEEGLGADVLNLAPLEAFFPVLAGNLVAISYWLSSALISAERIEGLRLALAEPELVPARDWSDAQIRIQREILQYSLARASWLSSSLDRLQGSATFLLYGGLRQRFAGATSAEIDLARREQYASGTSRNAMRPLTRGIIGLLPQAREVLEPMDLEVPPPPSFGSESIRNLVRRGLYWPSSF